MAAFTGVTWRWTLLMKRSIVKLAPRQETIPWDTHLPMQMSPFLRGLLEAAGLGVWWVAGSGVEGLRISWLTGPLAKAMLAEDVGFKDVRGVNWFLVVTAGKAIARGAIAPMDVEDDTREVTGEEDQNAIITINIWSHIKIPISKVTVNTSLQWRYKSDINDCYKCSLL